MGLTRNVASYQYTASGHGLQLTHVDDKKDFQAVWQVQLGTCSLFVVDACCCCYLLFNTDKIAHSPMLAHTHTQALVDVGFPGDTQGLLWGLVGAILHLVSPLFGGALG
jgi:hypothetical protein